MPSRWIALQKWLEMIPSKPVVPVSPSDLVHPNGTIRVLLVEDDPGEAELLRAILSKVPQGRFVVTHVARLREAREHLGKGKIDVAILDLLLPDSNGLQTVEQAHAAAPEVPIVVLTGCEKESLAAEAILVGAQYYILKSELTPPLLLRAIRYALGPEPVQEELRSLALRDELTGVLNLRGFAILAEQQLKMARRARRGLLLAMFDMDDLKNINDTFGHSEGSQALVETAEILRASLRGSDIIGRLGGDEFAGLILEATAESGQVLAKRLRAHLEKRNARSNRGYQLWISVGVAAYDPQQPCSLNELLAQADQRMYEAKRSGKAALGEPGRAIQEALLSPNRKQGRAD